MLADDEFGEHKVAGVEREWVWEAQSEGGIDEERDGESVERAEFVVQSLLREEDQDGLGCQADQAGEATAPTHSRGLVG